MFVNTFGQTTILLEKSGGVYMIPCIVNGTRMKMVFDTGASTVSLSLAKANELVRNGKLSQKDFLGYGQSSTANGDIVDHLEINLRTIQIGGHTLKNTRAVIISGQNAPLLLGLSAIQKLGRITLDGNKLLIANKTSQHSKLRSQISDLISKMDYKKALSLLNTIENNGATNEDDICNLILCNSMIKQYADCLYYCGVWLDNYNNGRSPNKRFVYEQISYCHYELKDFKEAITWIQKSMELISSNDLKSRYYSQIGSCYYYLSDLDMCLSHYYKATELRLKYLGFSEADVIKNKVKDKTLGDWYQRLSMNYAVLTNNEERTTFFAILGAKCGNKTSIDFCKYANINY